jgi:hypothetical protein
MSNGHTSTCQPAQAQTNRRRPFRIARPRAARPCVERSAEIARLPRRDPEHEFRIKVLRAVALIAQKGIASRTACRLVGLCDVANTRAEIVVQTVCDLEGIPRKTKYGGPFRRMRTADHYVAHVPARLPTPCMCWEPPQVPPLVLDPEDEQMLEKLITQWKSESEDC